MPKAKKSSPKQLEEENKKLKKQLAELEREQKVSKGKKPTSWLRVVVMSLLLGASATLLVVGQLLFWAGRTITNTDAYVSTVAPLIAQPAVQQAVATEFTERVFEQVDVQTIITDALPEKAAFLATPLTTQIKNYTYSTALKIVESPKLANLWEQVNRKQHEAIMALIRSDASTDGTINLNEVYSAVSAELKNTPLKALADKQLPSKIGEIKLLSSNRLKVAHNIVVNLPLYRMLSIGLFLVFFAVAIWVSTRKRRTLITAMIIYTVLLTLLAVSIRLAKSIVLGKVAPEFQSAVSESWRVIVKPLYQQIAATGILAIIVALGAYLSGPYTSAKRLQNRFADLFDGNVHGLIFGDKNPAWSRWIGRHIRVFYTVILLGSLVVLVVAPISTGRVVATTGLTILLMAVVRLIASPPSKQ